MGYIKRTLSQGEEIKLRAHLHWLCFLDEWIFTIVSAFLITFYIIIDPVLKDPNIRYIYLGITGLICYYTLHKWFKILSIDMVITNRRVIYKEGVFAVKTSEILSMKIESINIKQTFFGYLFGYADIHFSGTGTAHVTFFDVSDAHRIKSELEYIISQR